MKPELKNAIYDIKLVFARVLEIYKDGKINGTKGLTVGKLAGEMSTKELTKILDTYAKEKETRQEA